MGTVTVHYRAEIFKEGDVYVGLSPDLNVSSFDDTPQHAANALQEAVELFLEGCKELGTLEDILSESGFDKFGDTWKLRERVTQDSVALVSSPS